MGLPAAARLTYADYLALEEASEVKHIFADGEIFAMSGGTRKHSSIQTNLVVALGNALAGSRCRPHGSELRIYLPHLGEGCYADALVICGGFRADPTDPEATVNPTALFEVLSPTTEAYDRGRKFEKYRGLPALHEYVLLAQDRPFVEIFSRQPDGSWNLRELRPGDHLELASVGIALAIDDLYDGVFED